MDLQLDLNSGKLDLTWFNHQNLGVGFIKTIGVRGVGFVRQQNLMLSLRQQPAQHRCVSSSFSCQQGQIPWRIHGAGIYIYTNINGVYWWDPCYHIYIYPYIEQHHGSVMGMIISWSGHEWLSTFWKLRKVTSYLYWCDEDLSPLYSWISQWRTIGGGGDHCFHSTSIAHP